MLIDKSHDCTKHDYKGKQITICNVHKHQPTFLLQVGGWHIAPSAPWVNLLYFQSAYLKPEGF